METTRRRYERLHKLIEKNADLSLSLDQFLAELSLKIKSMPSNSKQQREVLQSVLLLVWQTEVLCKAINNPGAKFAKSFSFYIGSSVDLLVERQQALRSNLIELSLEIKQLEDPSFETFYRRLAGFIRLLSNEDLLVSWLLSNKDRSDGGSNGGNGSGDCGSEFPGSNPKLISNNRSMPWYQPQHFY